MTEGQIEWFKDLREAIENDPEAAIEAVDAAIKLLEREAAEDSQAGVER